LWTEKQRDEPIGDAKASESSFDFAYRYEPLLVRVEISVVVKSRKNWAWELVGAGPGR
jgi:hypothetical protein